MTTRRQFLAASLVIAPAWLTGCGGGGGLIPTPSTPSPTVPPPTPTGPAWFGFGRDAQHSSVGAVATQSLDRILWQTPVDTVPTYSGTALLAHYGSPVITARNTVVVGVKTSSTGAFRLEGRAGTTGALIWSATTTMCRPPARAGFPVTTLCLPHPIVSTRLARVASS